MRRFSAWGFERRFQSGNTPGWSVLMSISRETQGVVGFEGRQWYSVKYTDAPKWKLAALSPEALSLNSFAHKQQAETLPYSQPSIRL